MTPSPILILHIIVALSALLLGPWVLWARLGQRLRPAMHKKLGYAWVILMLLASITAIFIRDYRLPNIAGYTPIHVLVPITLGSLFMGFYYLKKKNIQKHRRWMTALYLSACIGAGSAAMMPGRFIPTTLGLY